MTFEIETFMTLGELKEDMKAHGYEQKAPPSYEAEVIDRDIAEEEAVCPVCKQTHGTYVPFCNDETGSYRAFIYFPTCNFVTEF